MQLTLEAVDPDGLDRDRLAEGMRRIEGIVPAPDLVDVVIAGDFVSAVRSRVADAEYARQYNTDRLHGTAVAKTIPQEDGRISIVFAAGLVDKRVDAGVDTERLFAHEGQHAAIEQRSETLSDIRIRNGLDIYSHRGYFAWVAGRASEEYRVERALCDEGWWPEESYRQSFSDGLPGFRETLLDAVTPRYPGEPIDRCSKVVMEGFSDFVMHAGYLAAEHLASDGQRTPEKTSSLWPRLLDDSWKELLASLGEIPSASVETARQELDAFAFGSIDVLDRWLKHIGFAIHDLEGGSIYFKVLRQDF